MLIGPKVVPFNTDVMELVCNKIWGSLGLQQFGNKWQDLLLMKYLLMLLKLLLSKLKIREKNGNAKGEGEQEKIQVHQA